MSEEYKHNYIIGAVAFFVMIAVNFGFWRLFFAPTNGVFKLFTPMYGLSLVAFLMFSVTLVSDVFRYDNETNSIGRGLMLTVISFVIFFVGYYGFFWNILGKYGVTYFSPYALIDAGGTGAEIWNMRENSSLAILYLITAFLWISYIWNSGMPKYPWQNDKKTVMGISKFSLLAVLAIFLYAIFYHPNITALFVPKQVYAGVIPWWQDIAMTSSSFYHLGWMFAGFFTLMFLNDCIDGFPFNKINKESSGSWLAGVAALVIAVVSGFVILYAVESLLSYYWYEPFTGGNYTDDPRFRHIHVAEISAFFMLGVMIVKVYFNNVINTANKFVNYIARLAAVSAAGLIIYFFYYSETIGPKFMDRVPGIGNIDDTSLCWTVMSIVIIMIHDKFFNALPVRRK